MTRFDAADLMAALYSLPEDSAAAHILAAYRELGQVAMRAVLSNGKDLDVFSLETVVASLEMARPRLYQEMAARGVLGRQCGAVLRHASGFSSVCDRPYGHDGPAPTGHRSYVLWNASEPTCAHAPEPGDALCQEPYTEASYSLPCVLGPHHEGPHMPNGQRLRRLRLGEPQESAERLRARPDGTTYYPNSAGYPIPRSMTPEQYAQKEHEAAQVHEIAALLAAAGQEALTAEQAACTCGIGNATLGSPHGDGCSAVIDPAREAEQDMIQSQEEPVDGEDYR